ncbi:hypothetical protein BKA80DRAFT_331126 [Phyllosticta citrichinensis]
MFRILKHVRCQARVYGGEHRALGLSSLCATKFLSCMSYLCVCKTQIGVPQPRVRVTGITSSGRLRAALHFLVAGNVGRHRVLSIGIAHEARPNHALSDMERSNATLSRHPRVLTIQELRINRIRPDIIA